jgi:tRNA threonylcarbamoyladenosine biosynthesis protein TsaB
LTHALAIDTTSEYLSLALLKAGRPVASHYAQCGVRATRLVFAEIDLLLSGAEMKPAELDLILAAVGPGSFTGTRIGLAVARTFGQVLQRPVIGVDTLHLLAAQSEPRYGTVFHALLNCARDEVYHAPFQWREGLPEALAPIGITSFDRLEALVGEAPVVLRRFEPVEAKGESLSRLNHMPLRHPFPDGLLLLELGLARFRARPRGPFPPPEPIYLKSEAFRGWPR